MRLLFLLAFSVSTARADEYAVCDAALLARHWGVDVSEAKARALTLDASKREQELVVARAEVNPTGWKVCAYDSLGATYTDAERLAAAWGLSDPSEAKARIEAKIIGHDYQTVRDQLAKLAPSKPSVPALHPPGFGAFTQCDADILAVAWGKDVMEAKAFITTQVAAGAPDKVQKKLEQARKINLLEAGVCTFDGLPFSLSEAAALAKLWEIPVEEAKTRVEIAARNGELGRIEETLSNAGLR